MHIYIFETIYINIDMSSMNSIKCTKSNIFPYNIDINVCFYFIISIIIYYIFYLIRIGHHKMNGI